MSLSVTDLSFLQQLYEKDTLYFVPEEQSMEAIPLVQAASVIPKISPIQQQVENVPAPVATPVKEETLPEPVTAAPVEEIKWLGEALKGTYLLFDVQDGVFHTLPQHAFLKKVLAAVGLSTQQVKFGNLSPDLVHDVKQIAAKNQAQQILLFGQGLPVANLSRMEFYRVYKSEGSQFVLVDSLEDIEQSVELKKKLWDVLQKIFLQQN